MDLESIKLAYPYRYEQYLKLVKKAKAGDIEERELISVKKYVKLINNLEEYISSYEKDKPEGFLREHQQDVFHKISEFLNSGHKAGYLDLPTGFGKTVLFVELVKALSRVDDGKKELKTLVLVPTQDLIVQTIGKSEDPNKREGFAKFAPEINATAYFEEVKDLSGDVIVSTYKSFISLQKDDSQFTKQFDLVILDEAHKALGPITKEQIEAITPDALKIGCTATSEYDEGRSVADILPELIHKIEPKEAVELGILANPRGFLYHTHIKLPHDSSSGRDYPAAVLKALNIEARNRVTVDFVKSFVQQGLRGLVPCLPGEKGEHAKQMAINISTEKIVDPETKKERNIIARAITQDSSREERDLIYEQFKSNQIDCITYIDILTTGKDLPNAKFLVRCRPRKSKVESVQEIGRLLRLYGDQDPYVLELEDEFEIGSKPYTIFDMFEIEDINQGQYMVEEENIIFEPTNLNELFGVKENTHESGPSVKEDENVSGLGIVNKVANSDSSVVFYEDETHYRNFEREERNRELLRDLIMGMKLEVRLVRELDRPNKNRKVDYTNSHDLRLLLSYSNPPITDWSKCTFRGFNDTTFGGGSSGLVSVKGTAILRGFGTKKENSQNLNNIYKFAGVNIELKEFPPREVEKQRPKKIDYSKPNEIRTVLSFTRPVIDLNSCSYSEFKKTVFGGGKSGFVEITGAGILKRFGNRLGNKENLEALLKFAGYEAKKLIDYDNHTQLSSLLSHSNPRVDLARVNMRTFLTLKFGGLGSSFSETTGRAILMNFGSKKQELENYNSLMNFIGVKRF